ncbi:MAG TPA: TetR family transcriptional regulator [Acidimicrobiales bacterium]|nr:TetR family transcriptional regulator [Acidimicrobiales bacterium]
MAAPRRPRAATAEKRERLLDATEEIMLEDGYAAVSSRSVATRVGINAPLVHYYFPTIDDLFIAVLRRRAEHNVARMAAALDSAEPLRAWWRLASDPRGTALFVELLAAANHRPALKQEVGGFARDVRRMQMERLDALLDEYGIDPERVPPALVASAVQGLAFSVVQDQVAGYETATDEAAAAVDRLLDELEERRRRRAR